MARKSGSFSLGGTLEILADAPADARLQVKTLADLTASGSFPYKYIGMIVSVESEQKAYMLIGTDTTLSANWQVMGEGGGGSSIQVSELPTASADNLGVIYEYVGDTDENYIKGYFYICAEDSGTYSWVQKNVQPGGGSGGTSDYDELTNKPIINGVTLSGSKTSSDLGLQDVFQLLEMPTADAEYEGMIAQYVGDTTQDYTNGYFYQCVSDGEDPATYSWEAKSVQAGGGGETYTAGDGINISVENEISTDNMQAGDMNDVIYKIPSGGGGGGGQIIQYTDLPTASAENLGKLVQYVGADDDPLVNGYYYECVSDGADPATYSWEQKNVQPGGGSGGGSTTRAITAAIDVGGIDAGTSYPVNTPLEDIISNLLEPTLYPTLTAPSATLTYGAGQYYAVGATVTAMSATVALNRGSINPAYSTSGFRSGTATGFAIATTGADTEYTDSSESSGSFSVPALTRATKGTIVVTGTASYAAGEQPKDSKGNDYESPLAAGSVSASKTLTFIQPYYYGASNSSTISSFTGLTESVTAKGNKTFNYTTNNQYMVFAYDSSYGNLKTILDGNGFDVTGGWTKNTVTVDGFSYFVYVANSPTTDTNAPFTFKY